MFARRDVIVGAGLAPLAGSSGAAPKASTMRPEVRRLAEALVRRGTPAISAGYAVGDRVSADGFGLADVENGVAATVRTAYRFASVQKAMTATAVLQLAEQGRIDLDEDIRRYVPYYPAKRWRITPRQLLGHLGGVPHYVDRAVEQHFTGHKDTRAAIAVFAAYDLVAEPGTRFSYSTYGYNLLGAAVEEVSGRTYGEYMGERVWGPAGMRGTRMDDPQALIPHRARGYRRVDGVLGNSEQVDVSSRFAGGGTRGTVLDLLRFMQALNGGILLPPARVEQMYAPMRTRSGGFSGFPGTQGYAMGWNVLRLNGRRLLHNDGGQQETRSVIINVPERSMSIATLQNLEEDGEGLPLALRIYEALTGEVVRLPA